MLLATSALKRSAWAPSWPLGLGLLVFIVLVNAGGVPLLADPDTQWHVAIGKWIVENGRVPTVDSHSFTFFGKPWIAKEWLSQVAFAAAFEAGGWGAVVVLAAAAIAATFALLLRLLLRDLAPLPALILALAAAAMSAPQFLARPHALALPFMLLWVAGLVQAVERRRAPRPVLLLAMLLWANLHGGFTLGLVLCAAFALEAVLGARDVAERKVLFVAWLKFAVAAGLVACLTPYGPESMLVTFRIFNLGGVLSAIQEWSSPDFHEQFVQEGVLLLGLFAAFSRGLRLPFVRLVIVLGLLHLYLKYARNGELLATLVPLMLAPILARQWPALAPDDGSTRLLAIGHPAGRWAVAIALLGAATFGLGMARYSAFKPPAEVMPAAAFAFVRDAKLEGPVFNDYDFGGALIQAGVPTFIDGRGELYGGDFIKHYVEALGLRGEESLERVLDRHDIQWTFLRKDRPANRLLEHLPGWRRAYGDDAATIFVRERPLAHQRESD
ncbi:MAG: hypothetical protein QOE49_2439 [Rhodospirillaceae bacterium]|jgi:hypothetical protein|nr:hypothetical protein [Rhodospirillaceae bacterium]MEA2808167.1 hypothetical protein [Rhodospirillaceae bacterium]